MWCWRRTEKTNCTDSVRKEELPQRFKEDRNTLQTVKRRNWSHLAYELPSKTRNERKRGKKIEGDEKPRKKT
jgi:hypothetical protein